MLHLSYYHTGTPVVVLAAVDTARSGDVTFSVGSVNFSGGIVIFANKTSVNNLYSIILSVGPNVTSSTFDYDVSTYIATAMHFIL